MVLRALIGQSVAYDRVSSQARPLLVGPDANSNRKDGPHSIAAPDGFRG
jgi:hypothetical protein